MLRTDSALRRFTIRLASRLGVIALATLVIAAQIGAGPAVRAEAAAHAPTRVAAATSPDPVSLGAASGYSVLGSSTVTNTGNSVISGDLGVSPGTAVTGFPPGVISANSGAFHSADRSATDAQLAAQAAYTDAQGRTPTARYTPIYDIGSSTFAPGVYAFPSSIGVTGTVTLDGGGNSNSVFIFQAGSTLITETNSRIVLTGGAQADHVFWQVGSSATLKVGSNFAGTIVAQASVTVQTSVSVEGRTLALAGAVTLDTDTFSTAAAITTAPTISISSPAISNSGSPKISGLSNAPVGTLVTVSIGTQQLIAHIGLLGYWTVTPSGLLDGSHPVHAEVSDAVSNVGSADQSLLVDTVAPAVIITQQSASNSATPPISGTTDAVAGSTVTVIVAGQTLAAVVDQTQHWSVATGAMADGTHPITAHVSDEAGNVGTATGSVSTDTTNPVLAMTSPKQSRSSTPTISGTTDSPAGSVITVTIDGQQNPATVNSDGIWSTEWPRLVDGHYEVGISTTDEAGNIGSASGEVTVDTVAPKVTITSADITNDSTPMISGWSDNPVVTIMVGAYVYSVSTAPDGSWSVTPAKLPDSQYLVKASVVDLAGNVGAAQLSITVDTVAPLVKITSPALTNVSAAILTGTVEGAPGARVTVDLDGSSLTTVLTGSGTFSVLAPSHPDGSYPVTITVVDSAGNVGTTNEILVIDTIPPTLALTSPALTKLQTPSITGTSDAPIGTAVIVGLDGHSFPTTIVAGGVWQVSPGPLTDGTYAVTAAIYDVAGNRNGISQSLVVDSTAPKLTISSLDVSPTATPTITGTTDAPEGTVVTVTIAGQTLTAAVSEDSSWAVTPTALPDGTHLVSITVTDAAGNTASATEGLLTDTVPPGIAVTSADHTRDSTPSISGTSDLPNGTVISVTVGETMALVTTAGSGGTWQVSPGSLPDGQYAVHASGTDAAGNVGQTDQLLTIDTIAPTLAISSPVVTNDTSPTLTGTTNAPAGAPVEVTIGAQAMSTTVTSSGTWSVTSPALVDGSWPVLVSITDLSGNTGTVTESLQVDTTAPAIAISSPTRSTSATPTIFGTADGPAGSVVSILVDGSAHSATLDAAGTWSLRAGSLTDGDHSISASVPDQAGNVGTASQVLTVDTVVAPSGPGAPASIGISSATLTKDSTPTLSGTSDAAENSVVTVLIDGQRLTTRVGSTGTWSVTAARVADGDYPVTASVTVAGVTGSDGQTLTVDTVAPTVSITSAGLVKTRVPTITGTSDAAAGTTVTVRIDGQVIGTNISQAYTWTVIPLALADGSHQVAVTVSDLAGNTAQVTQTLVVDTVVPTLSISSPGRTNDRTPTLAGSSDAAEGTDVTVTMGALVLKATVTADHTWSITLPKLVDGAHDITVSVSDPAGNTGLATQVLSIDTVAPGISVTSVSLTNNATPTISGTSDAAQGSIVTVFVNGTQIRTAVSSAGIWSVDPGTLPDGVYPITASVPDAAGNVGQAAQTLTVDTTPWAIAITSLPTSVIPEPTIAGSTTAPPFSTVTVVIGAAEKLTTLVDWSGHWSVASTPLINGTYSVLASTTDPAGNTGIASEILTVRVATLIPPPAAPGRVVPVVAITTGQLVASSTPTLSGTTNAPVGARVTVVVDGRTSTATIHPDGTWSVPVGPLDDGSHRVSVTATNASGTSVPATQSLTVDTSPPALLITSAALSDQSAPRITGTTDTSPGSIVKIVFDLTTLTAVVGAGGVWEVAAPTSIDGAHSITAAIADPAGNIATTVQSLVVDTTDPVIRIVSNGLTNNTSPVVRGTADVGTGVTVTVTVDGTSYVTVTGPAGSWTITAVGLAEGDHQVNALVTDPAGNNGRMTQTLVVDTEPPLIAITSPTLSGIAGPRISGTSTAPAESLVTVTVGVQLLTAVVGADATWSVVPLALSDADYPVRATVSDPAGNVAVAVQTLSVGTSVPSITIGSAVTVDGTTPSLGGTSNAPFGSTVTITVNGQKLLTRVGGLAASQISRGGIGRSDAVRTWTVKPASSAIGIYNVDAEVQDVYGTIGHATGTMTISAVPLPTLAFDPPEAIPAGLTPSQVVQAFTGGSSSSIEWGFLLLSLGWVLLLIAGRRRRRRREQEA